MADWSRIANTTIHEFVREEEINILRNRKLLAMMRERGRITMNHAGDLMDWKVRYRRAPLQGYADTDTLTFSRRDRWKTAQLEWRGYATTDSMTKAEKIKNKNTEAIVKIFDGMAKRLLEDIEDQFGDELYINGNAAGNSKRIHGFDSFTTNSASAGNLVATPNTTYAGLVTNLGNYGGSWTGTWPVGSGDAHYDFWSPLIVDTTNTGWAAATKTWPNTCVEAMRFGIIKSRKNKSRKGMLDLIVLNDDLYRQWLAQLDTKERIVIDRGRKSGGDQTVGFEDTQNFDGCEILYEYGVPADSGYGFNVDQMELRSLQSQLFVPEGPDFDIASQSWRFSIDYFGNLVVNPRYMLKLAKVS